MVICGCGDEAKIKTSWTDRNPVKGSMVAGWRPRNVLEEDMEDHVLKLREKEQMITKLMKYMVVFSTWMAFGGNIRDLGSFGEETNESTDLHQILEEVLLTEHRDGVAGIKQRRRDPSSDGV
ncbi:hypothetical protein Tco_0218792 [Tanacetum coccineum]